MQVQFVKFRLIFTAKAEKQLDELPSKERKQYDKAFDFFTNNGPTYRSLRTHRYRHKNGDIWSSSASMAKRFYWYYMEKQSILITHLDSH
jgi:phage-related protein